MDAVEPGAAAQRLELLAAALLFSIAASFAALRLGFFRLLKSQPLDQKLSLSLMLGAFLSFLFSQLIVLLTASFYLMFETGSLLSWQFREISVEAQGWFNVGGMMLSFFAVLGFYFLQSGQTKRLIWQRGCEKEKRRAVKSFLFGVASWWLAYPLAFFVDQGISFLIYLSVGVSKIEQVQVRALITMMDYPLVYCLMISCMVVFVPVMEEVLFRGFLQTWLRGQLRLFPAIVLTSVVFALFHFNYAQGLSNFQYIAALWLLSVFLGYLYEREQSLWAPIGLHMIFNAVNILILHFS